MGQYSCCRKSESFSPSNQFLLQINRYIPKSKNQYELDNLSNNNCELFNLSSNLDNNNINLENNNKSFNMAKDLKENLSSNKGKYKFLFYDINLNNELIIEKQLDIVKTIEGISELNFEQKLYLCGNSRLEDVEGSFLFEINPINPKSKILINSNYGHYYPSLISFKNKYIFCIGGKKQIHCESYNMEQNYWTPLPNLPEERYMCTLCLDSKNNHIYLFGGINSSKQNVDKILYIENDYILRLKNNINMIWEKISIKNENEKKLLKRISAASLIFDEQQNNIYILGGENEQKNFLDDIIKFDTNSLSFIDTNKKLEFPTIFFNQYGIKCENNNFSYVFIDKFNNIIKIDKHDFIEWSYDILEIL